MLMAEDQRHEWAIEAGTVLETPNFFCAERGSVLLVLSSISVSK